EVDKVVLGGNYGWNIMEGSSCYAATTCRQTGLIGPVAEYGRDEGISITGGFVYRGSAIPALIGRFIYGDYGSGRIWAVSLDPRTGRSRADVLLDANLSISSFAEGLDGELYVLDFREGKLHALVPAGTPEPVAFPQRLSETGCVDPADPTRLAPGVIPYTLNAPLWSDGAGKERALAIPDGTTVRVAEDGDFEFPIGSVLVKTFFLEGRRVETRLLMHHPDGVWAGYSYEWNEEQTDAFLLPASKLRQVGALTWYYPSRGECLVCHTAEAGRPLGPELGQLNGDFTYPSTGRTRNQLVTLDHLGIFEQPLPAPVSSLPRFPEPSSAEPLEARARAYLHSNCAGCHRPNGLGGGTADLRFQVPLAETNICDALPQQGDMGIPDARLVAPGAPERSLLSVRMHALDIHRMPPLGTQVRDSAGIALIDAWIQSLQGCPPVTSP
ncbi:MAG TPA: PQQ-dependent sugar dehydrogenase, partial [Myxococcaceae bacterium]|nr:PQQ-dependent sugar dehydrogenase [Myxococcaceae bacterium]